MLPVDVREQYMSSSMAAFAEKGYLPPNHHGANANVGKEAAKKDDVPLTTLVGFRGVGVPF